MYKYTGKTFHLKIKGKFNTCQWFTFKDGEIVPEHLVEDLKKQGGEVIEPKPVIQQPEEKKEEPDFDLNNDGKVDKKDLSIAGKLLRRRRTRKKKGE